MLGTCKYEYKSLCPILINVLALAWFCYDFVTYPFGIFSSTIISQLMSDNSTVQNIGYGVSTSTYSLAAI